MLGRITAVAQRSLRSGAVKRARDVRAFAAGATQRKVRVSHILLAPEQGALAESLRSQLSAGGADFAELAKQHSICPSSKRGGDLGWLNRGVYFPEFEAAATAAAVGQVVAAKTTRGHHVLVVTEERQEAEVQHMQPDELSEVLANPEAWDDLQLMDVREPDEFAAAKLPGFKLFPLSDSATWAPRLGEILDPSKRTIVLCHHGVRSMNTCVYLASQGFSDVVNVTGGIDAYSRIDPSIPRY